MTAYISLSMELAGCIVADMYFLSESNAAPKFPKLFEIMSHLYSKEKQDEIVAFIENVFREMIENERRLLAKDREKYENFELNNDNIPPNLQSVLKTEVFNSSRHSHVALHAALIAKAFGQSGYDDISQIFVEMAREDLQQSIHANEPLEEQENVIHIIPYINNENIQELLSPAKERREIERLRKIGGPKRGEDWKTFLNGKIDLEMVWVECGSFTMGDKYDVSDSALHTVTLTKGYWIGKYPLTQEQWEAIGCKRKEENYFQGVRLPVECISWDEAISFCQKLNEIMKDKLPRGYHFNLPTEAQWEFAAKGGIYSKGYEYSGSNQLDEVGWYDGNSEIKRRDEKGVVRIDYKGTHPVGQKKPNELGIYDMNGNVFEWCWNYFDKYPEEDETDPIGPENGKFRVFRGGSWDCPTQNCRPSYRYLLAPIGRISIVGFRVALVPVKDYK